MTEHPGASAIKLILPKLYLHPPGVQQLAWMYVSCCLLISVHIMGCLPTISTRSFWTHRIGLSITEHPRLFPATFSPSLQLTILFNTSDRYQLEHHQNAVKKGLKQMKEFIKTKLRSMMVDEAQRQDMRHLDGQLVTRFEHIREQFERNPADVTNALKIWFVYYGAPDIHKCWLDVLENFTLFSFNCRYSDTYKNDMVSLSGIKKIDCIEKTQQQKEEEINEPEKEGTPNQLWLFCGQATVSTI
jgi:hypothetical protein